MNRESNKNLPTMENFLESEVYTLVNKSIGQSPTKVNCIFISKSYLAVLIESVNTPLETFLQQYCQETVKSYREGIEQALEKRIGRLIERTLERPIHHGAISRQSETRWMGFFVLL